MARRSFGTLAHRRSPVRRAGLALLLVSTALVAIPKAEAAGGLEDPSRPDLGYVYNGIPALSADGRIFVGNVYDWFNQVNTGYYAHPDGTTSLPEFGGRLSYIYGMSGDGRWVVGYSQNLSGQARAFLWDAPDGFAIDLGLLYPAINNAGSIAKDVSGDGTHVVGTYARAGMTRGFAWIKGATTGVEDNEQMYQLRSLDDANNWSAEAISDDGRFAAGYSDGNATTGLATRWDLSGLAANGSGGDVLLNLGSFSGIDEGNSGARDISADGRVVVGWSADADGINRAFRWVEGATGGVAGNEQMYDLGTLDPTRSDATSGAYAVSRDGAYVVGWSSFGENHDSLAFRWTEETGMESVAAWLARNGVDLADGQVLTEATAVSDDGRVIAGVMEIADSSRAFIARVTSDEPGSGGVMDVEEYQRSLFATTQLAQAGEFLTWLPLNGAHHRPLLSQGRLSENGCVWAIGDLAQHGGSQTGLGLGEVGACVDLAGGNVRAGVGLGASQSWQDLAGGGSAKLAGQYVVGEVDWQPDGTPLLLSVTGMLGGWQANIHRGYSNGAATAYSDGQTGITGGVVRLRADWLEAARLGNTTINPWTSVAVSRLAMGGYVETGGPFPASFAAQSLSSYELRLGVTAVTELAASTTLTTTLELVHRSGDAPAAKGNVVGLFDFNLGGGVQSHSWARIGADLDHQLNDHLALSVSLNAATSGRDASLGGSVGLKASF